MENTKPQKDRNSSTNGSLYTLHIKPICLEMSKDLLVEYFRQFGKNFVLKETTEELNKTAKLSGRTFEIMTKDEWMCEEILRIEHNLEELDLHINITNEDSASIYRIYKRALNRKRVTIKIRDVPSIILKTEDYTQLL